MSKPKILIWDIETSPNTVYTWRAGYKINITPDNIIEERQIICICYKYLGEKKIHSLDWGARRNDKALVKKFAKILNKCDAAIAHNGDRFDLKWFKGRCLHHKTDPVNNISTIDTLKLSRTNFNLNSHRLNYLGDYVGKGHKLETGFGLWKDVLAGSKKALSKMIRYCKRDVELLEDVFVEILPYVDRLPVNLGLLKTGTVEGCPKCGSASKTKYGYRTTASGRYQKYQCSNGHVYCDKKLLKDLTYLLDK